jgi:hypothetical protein
MFESSEKSPDVCLISLERSWFVRPIWCVPRSSGAGGGGVNGTFLYANFMHVIFRGDNFIYLSLLPKYQPKRGVI